ncbi:MAG: hypothetical protein ACR2LG_14415 [Actinomycetota bacterium]
MPTPEMAEASGRDEFTLGGCMVTEGAPTHECLACVKGAFIGLPPLSWDFARQPMNAAAPPDVSTPGGGAAHE